MKNLASRIATFCQRLSTFGHPTDLTTTLEPAYLEAAQELSARLPQPIPTLCTLVTARPFHAALHDACGRHHFRSAYQLL